MPHPDFARALRRAHPDRFREAFGAKLSDSTIARLRTCDRLHPRLSAGLRTPPIGCAAAAETDSPLDDPERAALHAGAFLHGAALRMIVSGSAVGALAQVIGHEAFAFGLRHGRASMRRCAGDLASAIREDGLACLGHWLRDQPATLARSVLLMLPPGTAAESPPDDPDLAAVATETMAHVLEALGASHA